MDPISVRTIGITTIFLAVSGTCSAFLAGRDALFVAGVLYVGMTYRPSRVSQPRPRRERPIAAQLAALNERLEVAERQHRQLRNTVSALGRELGATVGSPCVHCEESYLLIKDGSMSCPRCGYRESL